MDIVKTWLLIAAERREFDGVLKRMGTASELHWPGVKFACEAKWNGDRWWMVANGPGFELVNKALAQKRDVDGMISTGLCGALDPALQSGDIVVSNNVSSGATSGVSTGVPFAHTSAAGSRPVYGDIHSSERVVITVAEKELLHRNTGAVAVDMEAGAVKRKALEWGIPFLSIRVVSDTAHQDLPLDFNRYRNGQGDFSRTRIALAALAHPFSVLPRLIKFDRNCRNAAATLGDFLADSRF